MSGVRAKCLCPHRPQRPDLLAFNAGDTLTITDRSNHDWWTAVNADGQTGKVPAKFVQILEGSGSVASIAPAAAAANIAAAANAAVGGGAAADLGTGVALYDCNPPRADVLGFKKGDIIQLLSSPSEDWYMGELNGRQGLVAKNYIRSLPHELARFDKSPRAGTMGRDGGNAPAGDRSPRSATLGTGGDMRGGTAAPPFAQAGTAPAVAAKNVRPTTSVGANRPMPPSSAVNANGQVSPRPVSVGSGSAVGQPRAISAGPTAQLGTGVVSVPVAAAPVQPPAPATAGVMFRAIADYVGTKSTLLSFRKGDLIRVVDQSRQDWWRGELNGLVGAVPATYLRPVEVAAPAAGAALAAASAGGSAPASAGLDADERRARRSTIVASPDVAAKMRAAADAAKASAKTAVALYNFQQPKAGVLLFKKGDVLTIVDNSRADWWKAELNGKVGMVPAKYVEIRNAGAPATAATAVAPAPTAQPLAAPPAQAQPLQVVQPQQAVVPNADAVYLVATSLYKSPRPDILGLEPGLQMVLLNKPSPDWWRVQLVLNGRTGLVPAKFVQPIAAHGAGLKARPVGAAPAPAGAAAEGTARTQKAQLMAASAMQAQGAAANPAMALAAQLQSAPAPVVWSPNAGDVVEALVGAQWVRATVVAPDAASGGYTVQLDDRSQVVASKTRKMHLTTGAAPATAASAGPVAQDWKSNLKKVPAGAGVVAAPVSPRPVAPVKQSPAVAPVVAPPAVAPAVAPVAVVVAPPPVVEPHVEPTESSSPKVDAPIVPTLKMQPVAQPPPLNLPPPPTNLPPPPENVSGPALPLPPPPTVLPPLVSLPPATQSPAEAPPAVDGAGTAPMHSAPLPPAAGRKSGLSPKVSPRNSQQQRMDERQNDFEEARQEAKRRAELALDTALVLPMGLSVADLDRTIAEASMESVVGRFKNGDAVEARYGTTMDWYSACVVGSAKQDPSTGGVFYSVRYEDYGNIKLVPEGDVREPEAPPEVGELAAPTNMKFAVGAMIEGQYQEDAEWYVAKVNSYTPEGNYSVTFLEYGNHQECTPAQVRELSVPLEEVLPLLEAQAPTNMKYRVDDQVLAQYVDDGLWYPAQIKGITPLGTYWLSFTDYGNEQECHEEQILPFAGNIELPQ